MTPNQECDKTATKGAATTVFGALTSAAAVAPT